MPSANVFLFVNFVDMKFDQSCSGTNEENVADEIHYLVALFTLDGTVFTKTMSIVK
jgi:hypothetical protein